MYHTHSNGDSEMRFFPSTLTQDIGEKPWLAQVQLHVPRPWFTLFTTFFFYDRTYFGLCVIYRWMSNAHSSESPGN